jgi:predicted O-methyltransferase YrrM
MNSACESPIVGQYRERQAKDTTEEGFDRLCREAPLGKVPFESSECYGMGRHLRTYGYYPPWLPLCIATDHGPSQRDVPTFLDLRERAPFMFYHSRRLVEQWRKVSGKPCAVMFSPFVYYRRRNRITVSASAKGTLAFPAHSTNLIDSSYEIEEYVESLLSLPTRFHPIGACLYYRDIHKGRHKIFENCGIPVYTAGHIYDRRFTERFYEILSNFSFSTSNHFGSYAFYAVEMGIPFFIHGTRPVMLNKGDPNAPEGIYDPLARFEQRRLATNLFSGLPEAVNDEQTRFVQTELGVLDGMGRLRTSAVLYYSLLKWLLGRVNPLRRVIRVLGPALTGLRADAYLAVHGLRAESSIFTHLTPQEKVELHRIASRLGPSSVAVEIGSYLGASTSFIANALSTKKGNLYCVDTWQNETMPEGERNTAEEFSYNTRRYSGTIIMMKGLSRTMAQELEKIGVSVDLLFIDGDHSYAAASDDWELYGPLLRKDGIVIFHDTGWSEGVGQVVAERVVPVADLVLSLPNMQAFRLKTLLRRECRPASGTEGDKVPSAKDGSR